MLTLLANPHLDMLSVFTEETMGKEVQPKDTTREAAYELWMKAPNPMVTFFKTLDVTNMIKFSNKKTYEVQYASGLLHW